MFPLVRLVHKASVSGWLWNPRCALQRKSSLWEWWEGALVGTRNSWKGSVKCVCEDPTILKCGKILLWKPRSFYEASRDWAKALGIGGSLGRWWSRPGLQRKEKLGQEAERSLKGWRSKKWEKNACTRSEPHCKPWALANNTVVILAYQLSQQATLMQNVGNWKLGRRVYGDFLSFPPFFYKPKTFPQNKVYWFKKEREREKNVIGKLSKGTPCKS